MATLTTNFETQASGLLSQILFAEDYRKVTVKAIAETRKAAFASITDEDTMDSVLIVLSVAQGHVDDLTRETATKEQALRDLVAKADKDEAKALMSKLAIGGDVRARVAYRNAYDTCWVLPYM